MSKPDGWLTPEQRADIEKYKNFAALPGGDEGIRMINQLLAHAALADARIQTLEEALTRFAEFVSAALNMGVVETPIAFRAEIAEAQRSVAIGAKP